MPRRVASWAALSLSGQQLTHPRLSQCIYLLCRTAMCIRCCERALGESSFSSIPIINNQEPSRIPTSPPKLSRGLASLCLYRSHAAHKTAQTRILNQLPPRHTRFFLGGDLVSRALLPPYRPQAVHVLHLKVVRIPLQMVTGNSTRPLLLNNEHEHGQIQAHSWIRLHPLPSKHLSLVSPGPATKRIAV